MQMLDRDLEDAEEQYRTALQGHLQVIDNLLDLQYSRMKTLRQQFQASLKVRPCHLCPCLTSYPSLQNGMCKLCITSM